MVPSAMGECDLYLWHGQETIRSGYGAAGAARRYGEVWPPPPDPNEKYVGLDELMKRVPNDQS